jgi:hypothetical protein
MSINSNPQVPPWCQRMAPGCVRDEYCGGSLWSRHHAQVIRKQRVALPAWQGRALKLQYALHKGVRQCDMLMINSAKCHMWQQYPRMPHGPQWSLHHCCRSAPEHKRAVVALRLWYHKPKRLLHLGLWHLPDIVPCDVYAQKYVICCWQAEVIFAARATPG